MSSRILALAALALVPLAHAAPVPFLAPRGPGAFPRIDELQGEWAAADSIPALAAEAHPGQGLLRVRGSTFTFRGRVGGPLVSYETRVGPGGAIDFPAPPLGTYLGVYRIKGDILTIRYAPITVPRPASVDGNLFGYLERYKRVGR